MALEVKRVVVTCKRPCAFVQCMWAQPQKELVCVCYVLHCRSVDLCSRHGTVRTEGTYIHECRTVVCHVEY